MKEQDADEKTIETCPNGQFRRLVIPEILPVTSLRFSSLSILRPSFEGAAAALLLLRMLIHRALTVLRMRFHAALTVLRTRFHAALPLHILAEGIEGAGAALARIDHVVNVIPYSRFFSR